MLVDSNEILLKQCKICLQYSPRSEFPSKGIKKKKSYCKVCTLLKQEFIIIKGIRYVNNMDTSTLEISDNISFLHLNSSEQIINSYDAKRYVDEVRAIVLNENKIIERYSSADVHNIVVQRDNHICSICKLYGDQAIRKIPLKEGGLCTIQNCICVCISCKDMISIEKNLKSGNTVPVNSNERLFLVSDKSGELHIEMKSTVQLSIYCDASNFKKGNYGTGLVFVGNGKAEAKIRLYQSSVMKFSVLGELLALQHAMEILFNKFTSSTYRNYRQIVIYSDLEQITKLLTNKTKDYRIKEIITSILELLEFIKIAYPRINILIRYLTDKHNGYYKLSHRLSRSWIPKKV